MRPPVVDFAVVTTVFHITACGLREGRSLPPSLAAVVAGLDSLQSQWTPTVTQFYI